MSDPDDSRYLQPGSHFMNGPHGVATSAATIRQEQPGFSP
jgi:hypothetical protein